MRKNKSKKSKNRAERRKIEHEIMLNKQMDKTDPYPERINIKKDSLRSDLFYYYNMAKIGIVVGLLSIPVASMTNRFGFGQIPQLLGGIMAIGGALMAIYYECNHIMFDDK